MSENKQIPDVKRVVLSLGRRLIQDEHGFLNYSAISNIVFQVCDVHKSGIEVVLVTPGAIAAGREICGDLRRISSTQRQLVYYSVGQLRLMSFYRELFMGRHISVGQMLIGRTAFSSRSSYISIRDTLGGLLGNSIIPIINDNDVLTDGSTENSDNDHLAAYVAGMISADRVVFATDQKVANYPVLANPSPEGADYDEGSYPLNDPLVRESPENKNILEKIGASFLLNDLGIDSIICDGRIAGTIQASLYGQNVDTLIQAPKRKRLSGTRKWLATGAMPKGTIVLSRFGADVLSRSEQRGSLLARGVEEISGRFEKGDVVSVCDAQGRLLGYGITRYGSEELPILMSQDGIVVIHANYFYGANLDWYVNKQGTP